MLINENPVIDEVDRLCVSDSSDFDKLSVSQLCKDIMLAYVGVGRQVQFRHWFKTPSEHRS